LVLQLVKRKCAEGLVADVITKQWLVATWTTDYHLC